jgi:hypothetical protein
MMVHLNGKNALIIQEVCMTITADIQVEELVDQYPTAGPFLAERGIVCIKCGEPYWGTLRELAALKGKESQIEQITKELNEVLGLPII